LTNNNYYLALIATKSCKNNFCSFVSLIMVLIFYVNFKFFKLIFAVFAAEAIVSRALHINVTIISTTIQGCGKYYGVKTVLLFN